MDENRRDRTLARTRQALSRRAVARGVVGGSLLTALLAAAGQVDALAQGTPAVGETGPRRYVLKGKDVEIVFTSGSAGAEARLDYRDAVGSVTFAGADIAPERSPALGRFVSVGIEYVADGYDRYLTLLIPDVNPEDGRLDVEINTAAIITTHLTSIGGPGLVKGALQTYEVLQLDGVAEFAAE